MAHLLLAQDIGSLCVVEDILAIHGFCHWHEHIPRLPLEMLILQSAVVEVPSAFEEIVYQLLRSFPSARLNLAFRGPGTSSWLALFTKSLFLTMS